MNNKRIEVREFNTAAHQELAKIKVEKAEEKSARQKGTKQSGWTPEALARAGLYDGEFPGLV